MANHGHSAAVGKEVGMVLHELIVLFMQLELEAIKDLKRTMRTHQLPYTRKLSREKRFTNWWRIRNSRRKLLWIASATNYMYVWVWPPFADGPKTSKFAKVFSLESFLLYGILLLIKSEPRKQNKQQNNLL